MIYLQLLRKLLYRKLWVIIVHISSTFLIILFTSGCSTYGEKDLLSFNDKFNANLPAQPLYTVEHIHDKSVLITLHQGEIFISPRHVRAGFLRSAAKVIAQDISNKKGLAVDSINFRREISFGWVHILANVHLKKAQETSNKDARKTHIGTGFFVDENGLVCTAFHVVESANVIKIRKPNGKWKKANIIKLSQSTDIAILKAEIQGKVPYLSLANKNEISIGNKVFTIGFPVPEVLGNEPKYTEGTISSVTGIQGEDSLLQITVPVQPGNSGGPLVDENGRAVGVILSSASVSKFYEYSGTLPQSVNWAVKSSYVRLLLNNYPEVVENSNSDPIYHTKSCIVEVRATEY